MLNTEINTDFHPTVFVKPKRSSSILAGLSLILMALTAAFSYGIFTTTYLPENSSETVAAILSNIFLFKLSVLGWLFIFILDLLAAWAVYKFFSHVNKSLSLLVAWFRLAYTNILGIAILNLVIVLQLLNNTDLQNVFEVNQINNLVLFFLTAFEKIWSWGLILFGLHLIGLSYFSIKSVYTPDFIGYLLSAASIGYILVPIAEMLLPEFSNQIATAEVVMSIPMAVGELGFAIWLLIRGGKGK